MEISKSHHSGASQPIGEIVTTADMIFIIVLLLSSGKAKKIRTTFANPAVTIGRIFTGSVAGINPNSVLSFILAQLIGGAIGFFLATALKSK